MRILVYTSLTLLMFFGVAVSFTGTSFAKHHEGGKMMDDVSMKGTLFCILPGRDEGTVLTVIAQGPCNKFAPHAHVFLVQRKQVGYVYAVQGSPKAIEMMQSRTGNRMNFKMTGKISGNQSAWILTIN